MAGRESGAQEHFSSRGTCLLKYMDFGKMTQLCPFFKGRRLSGSQHQGNHQQLVCRVAEGHFGCCVSSPLLPLSVVLLRNLQMYQA